ncbi:MAG TPA: TadE family protein [Candidatus Nanopelagicales bacterium]
MSGPAQPDAVADRGSATLEVAILGPALLLLVFTVIQLGLWSYARSLALAAAQEGVAAAAAHGARPSDGVARARQFLRHSAGDSLVATSVAASASNAMRVRIEVSGRSLSVIPGVDGMAVTQSAEAPVERFTGG